MPALADALTHLVFAGAFAYCLALAFVILAAPTHRQD